MKRLQASLMYHIYIVANDKARAFHSQDFLSTDV